MPDIGPKKTNIKDSETASADNSTADPAPDSEHNGAEPEMEIGGRDGPDPTRYGDWELNGRCIDF